MYSLTLSLILWSQLVFNYNQSVGVKKELLHFKSSDGVEMSADFYFVRKSTSPLIILFHQAGWSRGEYLEIAPKLNALGYSCLAVDLRSGGAVNDVQNETNINALKASKNTRYVDAYQDMQAAVKYGSSRLTKGKLIVWGSSYSSSLALKLAGEMSDKVDAVIAFSPGEYFSSQGVGRDYITSGASRVTQPVFVTSARSEKNNWWGMYVSIPSEEKQYYLPETAGNHGAKALWSEYADSDEYWMALSGFLKSI
ncbi:dienelactone hydrolase family protein [Fulvivirga maritima]|uniref:alpha/beta hydrolase n=1 Tax=Fulvivirga maritima TaxID=2904247 RepID=UPI001F3C3FDF|nr:alpha/beta hydrolase [Fulvivirga maritima]UII26308.1 dienelactone hydrolase family protein [Fulvivirga maritima]